HKDARLLTKRALLERSSQTIIYIIKDGTARKRVPILGIESGDYITILEGAEAGDEVVVIGQDNLSEGVEVKRN
ncbi:multidrug transporter subunit MdtA, partial [candidate division KSB1 bacterium]|nr:multidrug transporter subunit MdtA [candidate division KSB1 bacterium]